MHTSKYMHMRTHTDRHKNKQYKTSAQTQNSDLCPDRIDFTRQLCVSTVARQQPQWPLTPAIEWPQCHLTSGTDHPQWASLCLRVSAILQPDPSDKAVLQKHQLSLNNQSQKRHWLGVSSPLANCATVWAEWWEGKSYCMQPRQEDCCNLTLWQTCWFVSDYFIFFLLAGAPVSDTSLRTFLTINTTIFEM